jgi:hypothetical protein
MENKMYLEEFLDKLTKMLEGSTSKEQIYSCINYIENYKIQLKEVIENEYFREATLNFLNELIEKVSNGEDIKIFKETE